MVATAAPPAMLVRTSIDMPSSNHQKNGHVQNIYHTLARPTSNVFPQAASPAEGQFYAERSTAAKQQISDVRALRGSIPYVVIM